jgi:hypothetical protein
MPYIMNTCRFPAKHQTVGFRMQMEFILWAVGTAFINTNETNFTPQRFTGKMFD